MLSLRVEQSGPIGPRAEGPGSAQDRVAALSNLMEVGESENQARTPSRAQEWELLGPDLVSSETNQDHNWR